jgi:S-adenosylmethionine:tRNA ribosyltransferase-isomerase
MPSQFFYHLPEDRIALYPLEERSASKLLMLTGNEISDHNFFELPDLLNESSLLIRNRSKVIRARLFLKRRTGTLMEVFCLSFSQEGQGSALAECLIRNVKRIKPGEVLSDEKFLEGNCVTLNARFEGRRGENSIVKFEWSPEQIHFSVMLDLFGLAPLPPYIRREADENDSKRYQTIYAKEHGSVAAPTAGLHFSPELEHRLCEKNISTEHLILHVGLGTFKPMKTDDLHEHVMHSESFSVERKTLERLATKDESPVVCVGTTTLRTLESLYIAAHLPEKTEYINEISIGQWDAQQIKNHLHRKDAWKILLDRLAATGGNMISGNTSLMITPDYRCRTIDYLITNFHQPDSTLLLIVASLIGEQWKDVYSHALTNGYRFLSYGDACLFGNLRMKKIEKI